MHTNYNNLFYKALRVWKFHINAEKGLNKYVFYNSEKNYLADYDKTAALLTGIMKSINRVVTLDRKCGIIMPMEGVTEKITLDTGAKAGYITVGAIYEDGKNIFSVLPKSRFIKDHILLRKELGGDFHSWITLDSGEIIDITILPTLKKGMKACFGRAEDIRKNYRFEYVPYLVNMCFFKEMAAERGDLAHLLERIESPDLFLLTVKKEWEKVRGKVIDCSNVLRYPPLL